jgi:eukaryotic-like serine/threonine-protein kinase
VSSAAFALPDRALVLDRYRPLKPLGRGGSGSVWLARDEQTGLDVALKIVPREGKRAARAAREMEAASRLRHERCVRAYDFGGDSGHVYIAYEYVRGRTLREVLRADDVDDATAVEIAAQMLEGLAHAHRHGIVHRDVKPSNVLVEDAAEISVRVLDFGLAQFDEADTLTAVGDVPGTLAYISPERLGGEDATERSDVWAVGVILWEALAGSHPFWGVPLPQVASTIASGAPPLSARRSDLPRRLLAAIDGALSVDAGKRPPAARLAAELREAFVVPLGRSRPERKPARAPRVAKPPRAKAAPVLLQQRLVPAGLASVATAVGGSLLPFWPAPLLAALAVAAGIAALRAPRLGLALALAVPVFPLGNVAQAAAVVYGVLALAWVALTWRDPRAGLAFWAGPLLAPLGLLALLPLAVQPARGWWRRGLHAAAGVGAAAAVAGLSGKPLPLGGPVVGDLGVAQTERPTDVLNALGTVLGHSTAIATTALALGIVAALLSWATSRGRWGIAGLGAVQLTLVLAWAPAIPWVGFLFGTWLLCGLLVARPHIGTFLRRSGG